MKTSKPDLFKILLEKEFPQNLLLSHSAFLAFLKQRKLMLNKEDLEFYEENRFIVPVARVFTRALFDVTHGLRKYYEKSACVDPSKEDFCPWKEYEERAFAIYHPWQSLALPAMRKWEYYPIHVTLFYDKDANQVIDKVRSFHRSLNEWRHFVCRIRDRAFKMLPLLLLIEDRYLPIIRNSFLSNPTKKEGGLSEWRQWIGEFDPERVLVATDTKVDEIKSWREWLAAQANFIDPLKNWYLLVGHVAYHKRQKLKGNALLAQDYYEVVKLLGMFIEDLTSEKQLEPDDLLDGRHGEWKKEVYGAEVDFANRDVLRKIIYEYGLDYDYRMLLFVEGETEFHAIPIIADAMGISFAKLGIRLEKLGGYSEVAPKRIEKLLQYAQREGMIAYVIIDNHESSRKYVDELVLRQDLPVKRDRVRIWDVDFEEDNFSIDELIEATRRLADRNGVSVGLTPESIEEKREYAPKTGVGDILIALCEEQMFRLSKVDLGEELGHMVAERIKRGKEGTTKIEHELINIVKKL